MRTSRRNRAVATGVVALAILLLVPVAASGSPGCEPMVKGVEFIGEEIVPTGTVFAGTEIGGLSSISYDTRRGVYYAISDDQGNRETGDPVRYYTMKMDFDDGGFESPGVTFTGTTQLYDLRGEAYAPGGLDPEGFVYDGKSKFYVSAEAILGDPIVDPFIRRYNQNGFVTAALPIPDKYLPNGVDWGVRQNLSFESLNLTPDGWMLVTASEGALFQDGPASTFTNGSYARILMFSERKRRAVAEFVYEVNPWAEDSLIFGVNGIVEVLPIDNRGTMLVMERSFSVGGKLGGGTGNVVSIYEVSTCGATNVLNVDALYEDGAYVDFQPVAKRLMFEFDSLGIPIDNIEGMTFGPDLPDGRRSLVIVSDNNFAPAQFTQFIVLALDIDPAE